MAVYEYRCLSCGHEWEAEQRMTDPPLQRCPECKQKKAKRCISRGSFILAGERWEKKQGY